MNVIHSIIIKTIDNPLDGVLPDFSVFGAEFTELWQKILGGIWALGILAAIIFLIVGIAKMAGGSSSGNPQAYKQAQTSVTWAAIALGGLAALAVIVGAVFALVS